MDAKTEEASKHIYDVVIIGGGFAGLSAGLYFKDCNIKNIVILEARDGVGGRVCSEYISINNKQCLVDTGGAYTGFGQNRILKMAKRYNIKSYKIYEKGDTVFNFCGNIQRLNIWNIVCNIFTLLDCNYLNQEINKLSSTLNWDDTELMNKYDSITCKQWIESLLPNNKNAQNLFNAFCESLYCLQSSQISILYILKDVNSDGCIEEVIESQNRKFIGGMHQIAVNMRNDINSNKINKIKYNHIVQHIEYENDFCIVKCKNGKQFYSKYVLCCIPISLYKTIKFKPRLSWHRENICNSIKMGYVIKINIFYQTAFWREKGFNGLTLSYGIDKNDEFPIIATLDDTKYDGSFPSIMGIIVADKAIKNTLKYSKEERKEIILKQYYKLFNDKRAITQCIAYIEKIWHNEEFSDGGYSGIPLMNVLSKSYFHSIYHPERKHLYFACTELATKWCGYIDGAIQSGQREANKIAILLKKQDTKIHIVKYVEIELAAKDCQLESVINEYDWIEKYLPNSRKVKKCAMVLFMIIVITGIVILRKYFFKRKKQVNMS